MVASPAKKSLSSIVPAKSERMLGVEPTLIKEYEPNVKISSLQISILVLLNEQEALLFEYFDKADAGYLIVAYGQYVLAIILLVLIAYLLSRHVYGFLCQLKSVLAEVSGGNYDVQAEVPATHEFKQLTNDFNDLVNKLASAQKNQHIFTAAIGHELRTPLTRSRLALDMLAMQKSQAERDILLKELDEGLTDLQSLSEDVIWLAKFSTRGVEFPEEELELCAFINEMISNCDDP